ncbi:MAG: serine/threonine protein kinase [Gemmatimonadota bacterium]|nr:MAG: serine/threonine protein kinase [Gemmatimonadota bacterium]
MSDLQQRLQEALSDRYRVLSEIGHGAMAYVYLAERHSDSAKVAVKVMDPDMTMGLGAERFLREIKISSALEHPHIVPILDQDHGGDLMYFVMQYIEGESLRALMTREGQMRVDPALGFSQEVGSALSYAHAHGVIHRDIKPENVLISDGHAVVADFGVARAIQEAHEDILTAPGVALGTPDYMSPEQARGTRRLDGRTDIYSLCCMLYEMLAGEPPFPGDHESAIMARRIMEEPPHIKDVRKDVPRAIDRILLKGMATNPKRRYSTATQFVEAIAKL